MTDKTHFSVFCIIWARVPFPDADYNGMNMWSLLSVFWPSLKRWTKSFASFPVPRSPLALFLQQFYHLKGICHCIYWVFEADPPVKRRGSLYCKSLKFRMTLKTWQVLRGKEKSIKATQINIGKIGNIPFIDWVRYLMFCWPLVMHNLTLGRRRKENKQSHQLHSIVSPCSHLVGGNALSWQNIICQTYTISVKWTALSSTSFHKTERVA